MPKKGLTKKLRDSGVGTPESDRIAQVLAKAQSRPKPHKHKWYPEGAEVQYCRCGGRTDNAVGLV